MVNKARPHSAARRRKACHSRLLAFIAADPERLGRFLAATGIGPADIRAAAREPLFLAGVLDHLANNETELRRLCRGNREPLRPISCAAATCWRAGAGSAKRHDTVPPEQGFCRDCLADAAGAARCKACGSPRLLRHPEIATLTDRPCRLRRLLRHDREARRSFACRQAADRRRRRSAASSRPPAISRALSACVRRCRCSRHDGYARMRLSSAPTWRNMPRSRAQVRALMRDLTPLVEPVSIDEAFLDLSGTERLHGRSAAQSLARFAADVERTIGITVSIGLSYNKFLAKIASDLDKPRGFAVLGRAEAPGFLAGKPVSIIFGVGRVAQERLARDGYRMIADLQKADERDLMRRLRRRRPTTCAARARHRRSQGRARPRCQKRFGRDHFRHRYRRTAAARKDPLGSERAGLRAAEGEGDLRLDSDAEAQDRGFPDSNPRPLAERSDPACAPHFRLRTRTSGARDRRHANSA